MVEQDFLKVIEYIKDNDNFILATHLNYDPDALSSLVSMGKILEKLNKNFVIYLEEEIIEKYKFALSGIKIIKELNLDFNNVIVLDCDRLARTGDKFYNYAKDKITIIIDHHNTNQREANLNLVLNSSSTAEIVYLIAKELKINIDNYLSTLLLLGILGDTLILTVEMDSHQLSVVFDIVTDLIKRGGDYSFIVDTLLKKNWEDFKREVTIMSQAVFEEGILWVLVTDTGNRIESLTNTLNQATKDVKVVILFQEREDGIKLSLRSKGKIDVGYLAKEYFNGGGHKNAAGGFLKMKTESAIDFCLKIIKDYLLKLSLS